MREKSVGRKRLLAWSDSPLVKSGFGKISKQVLSALQGKFDFEIEHVALNHFGKFYDAEEIPWQVQSGTVLEPIDLFARTSFLKALEDRDYDFVWIQIDVQHLSSISEKIGEIKTKKQRKGKSFPIVVFYVPIDMSLTEQLRPAFTHCDYIVPYTEFGRSEILKISPELKDRIQVIGCGYDPDLLKRLDNEPRRSFRQTQFDIVDDKTFLIVNINRNTPRKMLSTTLAAFARFKKQTANTKLYLHTELRSTQEGFDIPQAMLELGLRMGEDVYIASDFGLDNTVSEEVLASIHSSADCFFTSAFGEGWGLNHTDAMALEVPVVAPENTVFPEHLGDNERGYLYPCKELVWINAIGFRPYALTEDAASALRTAYDDFRHYQEAGLTSRDNPRVKAAKIWVEQFKWEAILPQWNELFLKLNTSHNTES